MKKQKNMEKQIYCWENMQTCRTVPQHGQAAKALAALAHRSITPSKGIDPSPSLELPFETGQGWLSAVLLAWRLGPFWVQLSTTIQ
jgi:hypothetical protein